MDARENQLYLAVLTVCIVILVLVAFFTITIIRFQRRHIRLYKSKLLAEITTLENERSRVAADLHDELGPIVAGIKLKLNSLSVDDPRDAATLESVHANITELIRHMKDISNNLMPVLLTKKGLVAAMERAIEDYNLAGKIRISFKASPLPALPIELSVNLYRILLEIIHNAIKHSGAQTLDIVIGTSENEIQVKTRDNGRGFDHKLAARENLGLGLRNLLSRTELLNGKMYVESEPGKGTGYTFIVPYKKE